MAVQIALILLAAFGGGLAGYGLRWWHKLPPRDARGRFTFKTKSLY